MTPINCLMVWIMYYPKVQRKDMPTHKLRLIGGGIFTKNVHIILVVDQGVLPIYSYIHSYDMQLIMNCCLQ